MPNKVYSGTGQYYASTLMATYSAYLPTLPAGESFEFNTGTIYNISSAAYPNQILIFMKVVNGNNVDLSGLTNNPPTVIPFSLQASVTDIDAACIALDFKEDIKVILFHDLYYDLKYVKKNIFKKDPYAALGVEPEEDNELESSAIIPKKGSLGTLKRFA